MDNTIFQMALEHLKSEVSNLQEENKALKDRLKTVEDSLAEFRFQKANNPSTEDSANELMDTKEVQGFLGVCYNTLQKIIKKGLITPIRIGQRRIRFSRKSVQKYVEGQHSTTPNG